MIILADSQFAMRSIPRLTRCPNSFRVYLHSLHMREMIRGGKRIERSQHLFIRAAHCLPKTDFHSSYWTTRVPSTVHQYNDDWFVPCFPEILWMRHNFVTTLIDSTHKLLHTTKYFYNCCNQCFFYKCCLQFLIGRGFSGLKWYWVCWKYCYAYGILYSN